MIIDFIVIMDNNFTTYKSFNLSNNEGNKIFKKFFIFFYLGGIFKVSQENFGLFINFTIQNNFFQNGIISSFYFLVFNLID